jgi:hypothetical protein
MKTLKIALAAAFIVAGLAGQISAASAKDAPGKCGAGKYFDVKKKKCTSK